MIDPFTGDLQALQDANRRIAELEAENHRLQTDIDDLEFVNKWSGERIAQLEGFVRATAEDEGHLSQEAKVLLARE